jgi:3-oxoacyl-(acyl-carrier-protein) synthase
MKSRIYIEAFDCVTSTGNDPESFWSALADGVSGIKQTDTSLWPARFKDFWVNQNHAPLSCKIEHQFNSSVETLSMLLSKTAAKALINVNQKDSLGIIFASTKGAIEDFIWAGDFSQTTDPLQLVLNETIKKLPPLNLKFKQVVSNSCASSHASIALATKWLESHECNKVLVIAGDIIGAFIHSGFQTLKALSTESAKPFQVNRDGLVLGEAMTAILFSTKESEFELLDCQIFNEAHTVTGASPEGRGLLECIKRLRVDTVSPDFAIAHGTATLLNDQIEDHVLSQAQKFFNNSFYISGTKWSVGHTLGASGSVDLIAAMMSLQQQKVFSLNAKTGTANKDCLAENYVYQHTKSSKLESVLVTTLGFGGTNGALMVKRHSP